MNLVKPVWVNPALIKYGCRRTFQFEQLGEVIDGNWDLKASNQSVEGSHWYKAIHDRIIQGIPWSKTAFFREGIDAIRTRGRFEKRHTTIHSWQNRFRQLEQLFQNIKNDGYKTHPKGYDVTVNIGRGGNLLFNDGIHRLCMAKIMKINPIPVQISVRHPKWIEFKNRITRFADKQRGQRLYQPLTHVDLQHIRYAHDASRFNMIKENMTLKKGRLLDIGAYMGFFCFKFEDLGFTCYANEYVPELAYFMKKLRDAEYKTFKVWSCNAFKLKTRALHFDVMLALNIFHHFLKKKDTFINFKNFLGRIKTQQMFFQAHDPAGPQMKYAYVNFRPEDFTDLILKYSWLTEKKNLGHTKDGRTLFKLWK